MNTTNFTGFNASQAFRDINEFQFAMSEVASTFAKGGEILFDALRNAWFSPNAEQFAKKFSAQLYENTVNVVANISDNLAENAANASNEMAAPNGGPFISGVGRTFASKVGSFGGLMSAAPNGDVGMNREAVRNALNDYISASQSALTMLSSVPNKIALYDSQNNLQGAFQAAIEKAKGVIHDNVTTMIKELNGYMETEASLVTNAVNSAVSAISGN